MSRRLPLLSNLAASQRPFNGQRAFSVVWLARTLHSPVVRDCLAIGVLSLLVHSLITSRFVDGGWLVRDDTAWYLNRAHLLWRGVFDDAFVYTLSFPALVGAMNLLTHDLVTASMIVNALALSSVLTGTYLLGRVLYNRPIAWIGVVVLVTTWNFTFLEAVQQPFMLFNAAIVWCVLTCWLMARSPRNLTAVLFGLALVFALFTRLEGGLYCILLIPAIGYIYRSTHDWRQALGAALISGAIFGLAAAFYGVVIVQNAEPGTEGAGFFSLLNMLRSGRIPLDVLSRRYTDTLVTGIVAWWPLWVWWLVLAGLIWDNPRYRTMNLALAFFLVFNLVYAFILSPWPLARYIRHYVPFLSLLIGAIVWRPSFIEHWRGRVAMLLVLAAICQPGIGQVIRLINRPVLNYQESEYALDVVAVDRWLAERGWQNTEIFTLCGQLLPFTRSHFHLIYRNSLRNLDGTNGWWDSPGTLLPYIREHDLLFMACSPDSVWKDWDTFLDDPSGYAEQLQEVGRIDEYVFYQVVAAEAAP